VHRTEETRLAKLSSLKATVANRIFHSKRREPYFSFQKRDMTGSTLLPAECRQRINAAGNSFWSP